mmetsp:Transcript_3457/g.14096  ORF Transcript_3457/g.14096 Transcript_3457/m.14096 type:complete len:276 (-) Transcript_3457:552-1379(-)
MRGYVLAGPKLGQMPHTAVARYGDHPVARPELPRQLRGANDVDARRRTQEQTVPPRQVPAHLHRFAVAALERSRQQARSLVAGRLPSLRAVAADGDVEVARQPIDTDALGDRVEWVPEPFTLGLHPVVKDPSLHLVVQGAPLRIHQVALDAFVLRFEVPRDPREGPTGAARAYKRVQPPSASGNDGAVRLRRARAALSPNLRTRSLEVRAKVCRVLKLVREIPRTAAVGFAQLLRPSSGHVHEVVLVRDGHRTHAFHRRAERFHQPRLFQRRVVR